VKGTLSEAELFTLRTRLPEVPIVGLLEGGLGIGGVVTL